MADFTQRSMAAGEIAPALHSRADLAKYHVALSVCHNAYPLVLGGAENRAGTQFICEVKDSSKAVAIRPFTFNSSQTYVLELGEYYMRVVKDGGQVVLPSAPSAYNGATTYAQGDHVADGGINYVSLQDANTGNTPASSAAWWYALTDDIAEIKTPFAESHLFQVDRTQIGDVVTFAHRSYPVQELIRYDHHDWRLNAKSFDVSISPPAGTPTVTASPGVTSANTLYEYVVRAINTTTPNDSPAALTTAVNCTNVNKTSLAGSSANYNSISWNSVVGATSYDIYIKDGATWYLLASTTATSYVDQDAAHSTTTYGAAAYGTLADPTGVSAVASSSAGRNYQYKITAVADTGEESVASTAGTVFNRDPFQTGDYNQVSWSTVSGAVEYNVYKEYNGLFGYAGTTKAATWRDDNIQPDLSSTPPDARNPFSSTGNYPGTVEYHEQRQFFANTTNEPRTIWSTRSALYNNMTISTPAQDDNAITFTIASNAANEVHYLLPASSYLLSFADRGTVAIRGQDGYLTPKQPPQITAQGTVGSDNIRPLRIGRNALFVSETGRAVHDLSYEITTEGYESKERSVMSKHLLEQYGIVDWCYAHEPNGMVWAVRSDGVLLSMTYHREHDVFGWARHDTDGYFEACCSVREGSEDAVYFVVRRTINGQTKRYIERLHSRQFTSVEDAFFVDCGLTYSGSAATTISGLDHLEGKEVAVLADGDVHPNCTVSSGQITLDYAASKVHVGLPITSDIETLDVDPQASGVRGKLISVDHVTVSMLKSRGGWVGHDDTAADMYEIIRDEDLYTGEHQIELLGDWNSNGRVHIQQRSPLPLTVLAITPHFTLSNV